MKISKNKIPVVLIASALGVIALVVSQLIWMRYSWQLSEQIFNQRVAMALCSTIENYDGGKLCSGGKCSMKNDEGLFAMENDVNLPTQLLSIPAFRSELSKSLNFHQINLDYDLSLSRDNKKQSDVFQSIIMLPDSNGQNRETYLKIAFPNKKAFILKNMNFMVIATVLILSFITGVLLLVNWSLVKQKRLLQTHVDFFNNMAHEFRTPLSNIGLAVNMLSKKNPELKDNQLIDIIRRENIQLLYEVERVLHIAGLENGDYALQKENFLLKKQLQSAIHSLTMPIEEKQAHITLDAVPDDVEIYGDKQHLGSVFRNLLDNALKYTVVKPDIRISAKKNMQGVLISFQDNGIGIPQGQKDMIFEKFQRIHHGAQHNQKGFGLGLAYVKNMIEMHKGYVRVSSEENKGSRFDIFLPIIS